MNRIVLFACVILLHSLPGVPAGEEPDVAAAAEFTVMAWNIWHGGREDGETIGPERVVDVIRASRADIIGMQETYGSGELISKALGFHFHPRGTNVSIHSRFPIIEDLSVFEEFKCVGALIELPDGRRVAFFSLWLPYDTEIWEVGTRDTANPDSMVAACNSSAIDLRTIKELISMRLQGSKYQGVPVIIAGDFNSMSHLDYTVAAREQHEVVIDWPTSHVLLDDGFRDSFRELHPEVNRSADRTWSPRFPKQQQDRIDYIYYRGAGVKASASKVIDSHSAGFPSDHAALLSRFVWPAIPEKASSLRVMSYNMRHGRGTDDQLALNRTADLLRNVGADIVGLQEVDNKVDRSGGVDQAAELGRTLGKHSAFGTFMEYQGGHYGSAILSRYPIANTIDVPLPAGHEPRVALACEIRLPSGRSVMVVNIHLDWVDDDEFRFEQAKKLAAFLAKLEIPYLLVGDFNDTPDSRTLDLLSQNTLAAEKPKDDPFTFPSLEPSKEIDFVLASPASHWQASFCRALDAPKTSDHRPLLAELVFKPAQ